MRFTPLDKWYLTILVSYSNDFRVFKWHYMQSGMILACKAGQDESPRIISWVFPQHQRLPANISRNLVCRYLHSIVDQRSVVDKVIKTPTHTPWCRSTKIRHCEFFPMYWCLKSLQVERNYPIPLFQSLYHRPLIGILCYCTPILLNNASACSWLSAPTLTVPLISFFNAQPPQQLPSPASTYRESARIWLYCTQQSPTHI